MEEKNVFESTGTSAGSKTEVTPRSKSRSDSAGSPTEVNPRSAHFKGTDLNRTIPIDTIIDDKYRILARMSTDGAEARLYLCASIATGEELCIKFYHDSEHVRADVRDALLEISHRNIANLLDWGYWDGKIYEVWTYYKGQNLQQVIKRGALSEIQIVTYLRQVNSALQAFHSTGLVHQDIKPSNFIIMADGTIVLIDFGVSASSDAEGRTHVTQIGHTTDYSSPEVLLSKYCWPASDYYSLGVTLYEMLTGTTPYADYDENMVMQKIDDLRETKIPNLRKFSEKTQDLIKGLMQYNRNTRWGHEAVQAWLAGDYQKFVIQDSPRSSKQNEPVFKFGGKDFSVPSQIPELITRMAFDWSAGIRYMDGEGRFILLRDRLNGVADADDLWAICNETRSGRDEHLNYFNKLYRLYPGLSVFTWRGYTAENACKLGEAILNALWQHQIVSETSSGRVSSNPFARNSEHSLTNLSYGNLENMFTRQVVSQYLKYTNNLPLAEQISHYESQISAGWKRNENADLWYYKIGYALSGSTKLRLGSMYFESKAAFVEHVNGIVEACCVQKSNDSFINFCKLIYDEKMDPGFAAWADAIGMGDAVARFEKTLKENIQ